MFSDDDKYRLPLGPQPAPQPLRTVVFLDREAESPVVRVEEVSPLEAIPLLMNLTHGAYVLEATGQRRESFLRCSQVASQARAYRLTRPWGLHHLEATASALAALLGD